MGIISSPINLTFAKNLPITDFSLKNFKGIFIPVSEISYN